MKRKITIASTSFVLPKNSAWKLLSNYGELSFADYGDYPSAFLNSAVDETLVFVLFVQDLIKDPYSARNSEERRGLLEPIISLVAERVARSTAPTIFATTSWVPLSVINSAKSGDPSETVGVQLWSSLQELREKTPNLFVINLDRYFGVDGFTGAFDSRNWYFAHCRLSQKGLLTVARQVAVLLERLSHPRKKVLILDCDNTLWGGVVGEEGWNGLKLGDEGIGAVYLDFQRSIKRLSQNGVLLALSSKNNEAEVWEVFDRHASMIVRRDDLVSARINWKEKAESLGEIADELGLSLDSFVFWDDSPIERDMVKNALPMVEVVEVPEDVTKWAHLLSTLDSLQALSYTQEDRNKAVQYHLRANFSRNLDTAQNKLVFLKSIKMVPAVHSLDEATIGRAHQLLSKTNQFNLRSVRYAREEIFALAEDVRNLCFLGSLSDCYGDHGIVALVICRQISNETAFLDTFLMSCRVLGRHFEAWVLASLVKKLRTVGVRYLIGEYIPTSQNEMCAAILSEHNFVPLSNDHVDALNLLDIEIMRDLKGVRYIMDIENTTIPSAEVFLAD